MRHFAPSRRAVTLVEVLVVIATLGVFVALLLPAVQGVRGAAARAACANNLRQQAVALANFHAAVGHLPSGKEPHDPAKTKSPDAAWLVSILPYIEQDAVWRRSEDAYRAQPDWTVLPNTHPMDAVIRAYACPADGRVREAHLSRGKYTVASTSYLGVSGSTTRKRNGTFFVGSAVKFTDMTDGTSNTAIIGERPPSIDFWEGWWYAGLGFDSSGKGDMLLGARDGGGGFDPYTLGCEPVGFVPGDLRNHCHAVHFWSLHPGGAHFAFGDGSVRFLRYSGIDVLPALATRAGGESVSTPD